MAYQVINREDQYKRFIGVDFYMSTKPKQVTSHSYSYLYCRNMYKELGDTMGLDNPNSLETMVETR